MNPKKKKEKNKNQKKKDPLNKLKQQVGVLATSLKQQNENLKEIATQFSEYQKRTDERFNTLAQTITQQTQTENVGSNPAPEQQEGMNPIAGVMLQKLMAPEKSVLEKAMERSMLESITFDRIMRKAMLTRLGKTYAKEFTKAVQLTEEET